MRHPVSASLLAGGIMQRRSDGIAAVTATSGAATDRSGMRLDLGCGQWIMPFVIQGGGVLMPNASRERGLVIVSRVGRTASATSQVFTALRLPADPEINHGGMEPDESRQRTDIAATVVKAIRMLELVAEGTVSLPDLVDRLGISKTSTFRIAKTLVDAGLLETSGRSGYRIGRKLQELGSAYRESPRQ